MYFPNAGVDINPALVLLLGLMTGTLSGFFGVGGGFLITGGLIVLGVPPVFAAERLISQLEGWDVAGPVIRLTYVALLAGIGCFVLYDHWITSRRTLSLGDEVSTAGMARRVRSLQIGPRVFRLPGPLSLHTRVSLPASGIADVALWVPIAIGSLGGFMAGLLGAGGGVLTVPLLIFVLGVPTTIAIGTDLLQVVVTASVGTFLYSLSDRVDILIVAITLASASAGAQLGVTATRFVESSRIRFLFAALLLAASAAVALSHVTDDTDGASQSAAASALLLSAAGAICIIIAALLIAARRRGPADSSEASSVKVVHK